MRYRMKFRAPYSVVTPTIVDIQRLSDALAVRAATFRIAQINARRRVGTRYTEWEVWRLTDRGVVSHIVAKGTVDAVAA